MLNVLFRVIDAFIHLSFGRQLRVAGRRHPFVQWMLTALLMACASCPMAVAAGELAEWAKIENEVATLVAQQDFAALEARAESYRTTKARTPSGLWKLTMFYYGVESALRAPPDDEAAWSRTQRMAESWIRAYPASPTAYLVYAKMLVGHAWSYRGSGFASTVRAQDWAPFQEYMHKAFLYLQEHKAVASRDPHWYELVSMVAYVEGWPEDEFEKHIDEALDREPGFYQTYFSAITYYTPRWRGSPEQIERFARKALQRTMTTEGYGIYARIYWYASQAEFRDELFTKSRVDWAAMKKGMDDVLKAYPDDWNLNNFARFACLKEDWPKTAELMSRINSPIIARVWRTQAIFDQCKGWAEDPASRGRAHGMAFSPASQALGRI